MADFILRRVSPLSASACFDRLVDWDAHSAAIPLTTLEHDGAPRVGQQLVACTGVGRVGFNDPMVVKVLRRPAGDSPGDLPGVVEVAKLGRVIGGTVRWTVTPTSAGADVEWTQRLVIGWLPRWLDPLVGWVGRVAYGSGLGRILRETATHH